MTDTPEESEVLTPIVMQEVPSRCDTCGSTGPKNPILRNTPSSFGYTRMVVGYLCEDCNTQHIYQN